MKIIAIHQLNFLPWFPYFEKIQQADVFVLLSQCQYKNSGYTNRCKVNNKWWTNPVSNGEIPIQDKKYITGQSLVDVNHALLIAMCNILNIDTSKIVFDFSTVKKGTDRLIEIIKYYNGGAYLCNEDGFNKYLERDKFRTSNIEIIPFKSVNKKHVFELFAEMGIEKTRALLHGKGVK